jgi:hypothetical protein
MLRVLGLEGVSVGSGWAPKDLALDCMVSQPVLVASMEPILIIFPKFETGVGKWPKGCSKILLWGLTGISLYGNLIQVHANL